jgi:hypothetical protein
VELHLLAVYATFSVSELKKVDPDELVPEISFVVPHHLGVSQ